MVMCGYSTAGFYGRLEYKPASFYDYSWVQDSRFLWLSGYKPAGFHGYLYKVAGFYG